ncbi:MAG: PQQ-binding-like beta-propeller repeat protein [Planctomycetota bacterium]
MRRLGIALAAVWLATIATPVWATRAVFPSQPLVLDDGIDGNDYGWSVDVSGDRAIASGITGGVYVFDVTTGQISNELERAGGSLFGFSVAIDGDFAVVAAGQSNRAFVYDVNTGEQLYEINPTDNPNDYIRSVDISDGIVALGVPTILGGNFNNRQYGGAFIYDALSGEQLHRRDGSRQAFKEDYGQLVAVDDGAVVVWAPGSGGTQGIDVIDAETGALRWVFDHTDTGGDLYIRDISIGDDYVVVGGNSFGPRVMSTAWVLDRDTGDLVNTIDILVPNENNGPGRQIDFSTDTVFVGAHGTFLDGVGSRNGTVYAFDIQSGERLDTLINPERLANASFGFSLAVDGSRLVVGAPGGFDGNGQAFAFDLIPEPGGLALLVLGGAAWPADRRR